jgi:D-alanine-D-alanine ligase
MAEPKKRIAILFGGRSAEHDVSRASAANVLRSLDADRYDATLIGIARDGRWIVSDAGNGAGAGGDALTIPDDGPQLALLPGGQGRALAFGGADGAPRELPAFDVVFPVLHGPNGEDGTVQGALELSDVAYVGSRVMGSAAAMDKDVAKRLMRDAGLPIVPYVAMSAAAPIGYDEAAAAVGAQEVFVKPANMGSSVGVSRARNAAEFEACCKLAFRFDRKILVERGLAPIREVECSVLEDAAGPIRASQLGEIVPSDKHGFYSYDAKYLDADGALLQVPANVPPPLADRIKALAIETFRVLGCEGMARIDFFLHGEQAYVNEANTLPGFTNISMYPRLWEASGLPQSELMDVLIGHALERQRRLRGLAFDREQDS